MLLLAVAAAGLLAAACSEAAAPEVVQACEEVHALEEATLELAESGTDDPAELGRQVGEVVRQSRAVQEAAEEAGDDELEEAARRASQQVSTQVATIALDTRDPRAAAAPMAREVVVMRDICHDRDAYPY